MRAARTLCWTVAGTLVVLATRAIVYALSPAPLAAELEHRAGGPRLPVVSAVTIVLALVVSSAVVWLATLGVRERRLLEGKPLVEEPRLHIGRLVVRAVALFTVTAAAFSLLESYIHWRAGLGWHGIHCLVGPVHRDAVPVLGALSLVASAIGAAVEHVLRWLRRTIAELRVARRTGVPLPIASLATEHRLPLLRLLGAGLGARAPPSTAS